MESETLQEQKPKSKSLWFVVIIAIAILIGFAAWWWLSDDQEDVLELQAVDYVTEGNVFTDDKINNLEVITLADGQYRMFFHTGPSEIKSAISTDGQKFTMEDGVRVKGSMPATVKLTDGRWRMYYSFGNALVSAISVDGLNFTAEDGTRLDAGSKGSLDELGIIHPSIITLPDGSFKLYYDGVSPNPGEQLPYWRIMSATSPDGLVWTKDTGARIAISGNDENDESDDVEISDDYRITMAFSSHAEYIDGEYKLYFTVQTDPLAKSGVWLATSTDGIKFDPPYRAVILRDQTLGDKESSQEGGPLGVPQDPFIIKTSESNRLFYWLNTEGTFSALLK